MDEDKLKIVLEKIDTSLKALKDGIECHNHAIGGDPVRNGAIADEYDHLFPKNLDEDIIELFDKEEVKKK